MVKLTLELITSTNEGASLSSITVLSLPCKNIHKLAALGIFEKLVRLDLSGNRLRSVEALSNCKSLKWLSVSGNRLASLQGIGGLSNLIVLNGSRNEITSMDDIKSLAQLQALILNDNQISSIGQLDQLSSLNTLILSRNPVRFLGAALNKVASLTKVSLSDCQLQDVGVLKHCVILRELRLAHNKLCILPKELKENIQLHIIDVGNNCLENWSDIEVLSLLPSLENLNLRGNPLCRGPNYESEVKRRLPSLQVLDGHLLQGISKKRRQKWNAEVPDVRKGENANQSDVAVKSKKSKQDKAKRLAEPDNKRLNLKEDLKKRGSMDTDHKISDEKKPFLELILPRDNDTSRLEETEKKVPIRSKSGVIPLKALHSGVVSVAEKKRFKLTNSNSRKQSREKSSTFSVSLEEINIGAGGPSSWDM